MSSDQLITIISGVIETGAIGFLIFCLIKGLNNRIASLRTVIDTQSKTLEVMDKRIAETEKIGDIYKNLIRDLPKDLESYKEIISRTKDEMIQELEKANKTKDERLKKLAELKLEEINIVEQNLKDLPKLQSELIDTTKELQQRLESIMLATKQVELKQIEETKRDRMHLLLRTMTGTIPMVSALSPLLFDIYRTYSDNKFNTNNKEIEDAKISDVDISDVKL